MEDPDAGKKMMWNSAPPLTSHTPATTLISDRAYRLCMSPPLVDLFGRPVTGLRVSITNRCQLDCFYCHREGTEGAGEEMEVEDFEKIASTASRLGIKKVKITGGEPLIREDVVDIVRVFARHFEEVSLTTNGLLLADLAADLKKAGLKRANVSLDTLKPDVYSRITGYGGRDGVDAVMTGIKKAIRAGLTPVKVNTVLMKGINDTCWLNIARKVTSLGAKSQLVEFVHPAEKTNAPEYVSRHADMGDVIGTLEKMAVETYERPLHRRKTYVLDFGTHRGEVEVVQPMHNTVFCENCTRLRVTPDGKLKTCLLGGIETPLLSRSPGEEDIERAFRRALLSRYPYWGKKTGINLLLFSTAREKVGEDVIKMFVPPGTTAGDLLSFVKKTFPGMGDMLISVNREYADEKKELLDGDEVALFPPVGGG